MTHPMAARTTDPVAKAPDVAQPHEKPGAPPELPRSTRRRRPLLVGLVVAAAGAAGYGAYAAVHSGKETTDDAHVAAETIPLSTRVGGPVARVLVTDHQAVRAGDVLLEIESAEIAARLRQAEAELAAAKAQSSAADAQIAIVEATSRGGLNAARATLSGTAASASGAHAQVDVARAALARAEADAKKAESDLARAEQLRKDDAIPTAQLESAQAAAATSRAAVLQARASLAAAEDARVAAQTRTSEAQARVDQSSPIGSQLASVRASADLARARVDVAQAAVDLARIQLSNTKISAPSDGVLAKLAVHPGQTVQMGQLVTYLVPKQTYLIANFKETQIGHIRSGQRATVVVDAFPGRKLEAKVEAVAPGTGAQFSLLPPDNASGNFVKVVQRVPVRLAWSNPEGLELQAGLSAEVEVETR